MVQFYRLNTAYYFFFVNGGSKTALIPDVIRLLEKYNSSRVSDAHLRDGTFPSKFAWEELSNMSYMVENCISGILGHPNMNLPGLVV